MENICGFLDLPVDVLRQTWKYLTLPDLVRFGMTTKNMANITWSFVQEVTTDTEGSWPVQSLCYILSRDLSQLRILGFYYSPYEDTVPKEVVLSEGDKLLDLTKKISVLSSATNLQNLGVDFYIPDYDELDPECKRVHKSIYGVISSLTQLQYLIWSDNTDENYLGQERYEEDNFEGDDEEDIDEEHDEGFNIGQFLRAHTRLTSFEIRPIQKIVGLNLLTRLNELEIRGNYTSKYEETFSGVLMLTQLTSLILYLDTTLDSFITISKLVNLERLEFSSFPKFPAVCLTVLYDLPKLSNFSITPITDEERIYEFFEIVGKLSNLTALQFTSWTTNNFGGLGLIANLTNLENLGLTVGLSEAQLSSFTKLTRLQMSLNQSFKVLDLPPNLEELFISSSHLTEDQINSICRLKNLKALQRVNLREEKSWCRWISQLSNLTSLTFFQPQSKEFFLALQKLPNLAQLTLDKLPDLDSLTKLTQLIELEYSGRYYKVAKEGLPFRCNFAGDPYLRDFEYREYFQ